MRPQYGFTLIEVLVSFTLMSLIMVMVYSGIHIADRVGNKGELQINLSNDVTTVQTFIRRQLSGALAIPFDTGINQSAIFFRGRAKKVEFVSTMYGHLKSGGIYKQTIEFVDGSALVFRFEPVNSSNSTLVNKPEPVVLLMAKDVNFYYRDAPKKNENGVDGLWSENWENSKRLPALINIEVEPNKDTNSESFSWPSLIIAPLRYKHRHEKLG